MRNDPTIENMKASRKEYAAILLLSLAALVFEINLTRLFSVAQFYHFAFMIASLALLAVALVYSTALVLAPVAAHRVRRRVVPGRAGIPARRPRERGQAHDQTQDGAQGWAPYKSNTRGAVALPLYFALIGFAYLLVEMPLIQRFILFLGQPAYAMAAVLAALLLALPYLLQPIFQVALGLSLPLRLALTVLLLAPVGLLMGAPFPGGLRTFLGEGERSPRLPWVWSINGAASVVAAVLAALLAISFGFDWVLRAGALCYAGAWITVMGIRRPPPD